MKNHNFIYYIGLGILLPIKWLLMVLESIVALLLYIPFVLLFPTKIKGLKNLKKAGKGKIVAVNHYSNFDPIFLAVVLYPIPFTRTFVAKKEINKCKLIGFLVSCAGVMYIDRSKPDIKAMNKIVKLLKHGRTVLIFPEGTRNKNSETEDMQAIKSGVIFLSSRAGKSVVPTVILHRIRLFRPNKIIIGQGEIYTKLNKQETQEAVNALTNNFAKLREQGNSGITSNKRPEVIEETHKNNWKIKK